jgi:ribosome-associated translation inhibitor RaiA
MSELENVELIKFPELDEIDSALLDKNITHFFKKVPSDDVSLRLTCHDYARGGVKKQHEIKAHLILDGDTYFASDTTWQLLETVQNALRKLEKEVLKKHSSK